MANNILYCLMQTKTILGIVLSLLFTPLCSYKGYAQKAVRQHSRTGTKYYQKKEYSKAEIEYRKGLEINPKDNVSQYNLSNVLYRTDRREEALKVYSSILEQPALTEKQKADVSHNIGNTLMMDKKYAEAIEAYKTSLRVRPEDEETRYNLALAQKLLQKQQQQQQQQKDDKEKEQDKNKDKDKQDPKDQEPQNQDQKPEKTQEEEKEGEEKMSKDNAQKILDAFLKDEKDTQKKVDKAKQLRSNSGKNKKQW